MPNKKNEIIQKRQKQQLIIGLELTLIAVVTVILNIYFNS
jgi:hypothetical protein